ncbi:MULTISPECIES: hypothetical protein [Clostridium]|uniref:Uncharacterized protein n=1 Tax=Clostridium cibarium TaxID=2762247 RepID=A0ABR8PZ85_9CLOT|nr:MULTISPECIES: hypothetical protein [Clostridium]MBD7913447.1 hypothetical protein [Clostridium cibarium]
MKKNIIIDERVSIQKQKITTEAFFSYDVFNRINFGKTIYFLSRIS